MPKTKSGEVITWKEFFSRWKKGIEGISPMQKLSNETRGTCITLIGFIVSLFAVIYLRENIGLLAYGLILIFLGNIITTGLKWIGMRQQLSMLKNIEKEVQDGF